MRKQFNLSYFWLLLVKKAKQFGIAAMVETLEHNYESDEATKMIFFLYNHSIVTIQ